MSSDLVQQVAETLYKADSIKRGRYCCDQTFKKVGYEDLTKEVKAYYLTQAEAVVPLILDAAKNAIDEAYQELCESLRGDRQKPDTEGLVFLDGMEYAGTAIDKLRTKP